MRAVETARAGICQMIASGEIAPGQRLPGEVELAARLGVSRGSLREAQRMLSVAGVLDPSGRPLVSDMSANNLVTGLAMVIPLMPLHRLLELFPMREVLEGHSVAQATARMSNEEIDELERLVEEIEQLQACDPRAAEIDHEFHSRLVQGAGDEMISAMLATIHRRGADYCIFEGGDAEDFKVRSDAGHRRIIAAMRNRDPDGARCLLVEHIRHTRDYLAELQPKPQVSKRS